MVDLAPFRGLRFDPERVGDVGAVTAPPYDAIDPDRQRRLYGASPYNVVRLELGQDRTSDREGSDRYSRAADTYRTWRQQGVLQADPRPALYVYEQSFDAGGRPHTQVGLLAALAVTPWEAGVVLPHERIFRGPVEDRKRLLAALPANVSPIFLLTAQTPAPVGELLDRSRTTPPAVAFRCDEEVSHRLWVVDDPDVHDAVARAYADRTVLLADGHHRYTTAVEHHDERPGPGTDRVLAFIAGADRGPIIRATHRLVTELPVDALDRLRDAGVRLDAVSDHAHALAARVAGDPPGAFGLVTAGGSFLLRVGSDRREHLTGSVAPPVRDLDVTVLQALLLDVLGVPDDIEALRYTSEVPTAARAVTSGAADGLFLVRPVTFAQFRAASEAGVRMPPKSTAFFPKPRTGLVVRPLSPDAPA